MVININTQELRDILAMTPPEQNIMLAGRHGIGKSQILTKYFQEKGLPVVTLFLGQMSDRRDVSIALTLAKIMRANFCGEDSYIDANMKRWKGTGIDYRNSKSK